MFKLLTSIAFLTLFTFTAFAQDKDGYSFLQGAYVTNTAEDVKDDLGSEYYSDPEIKQIY